MLPIGLDSGFRCPLRGECFSAAGCPFPDTQTANDAVRAYQVLESPDGRAQAGNDLYLRHLPLVRKTLQRFCRTAQCYCGGCAVEDLVGETYAIFRLALDEYDAGRGVDFLGFAGQRLYWETRHRLRDLNRTGADTDPDGPHPEEDPGESERRLLGSVWVDEVMARLGDADAEVLRHRYAEGGSCGELAERLDLSPAAARKRLSRARGRLREVLGIPGG